MNMKKEKRYELYKRGELSDRNPPGINALGDPESSVNGNILENRSRYETGAPRSSLNNQMFNELMNQQAPHPKPDGNPQGSTPGIPQKQAMGGKSETRKGE